VLEHPTSTVVESSRRRRVTLLCAEQLRPAACCVEDALVARGWEVALETGAAARPALTRLLRVRNAGLLVICVPHPVDAETAARLRGRADPHGRGDVHVVSIETPRHVIEAVERLGGGPTRRTPRRPRPQRTILAHPTLVEQQVGPSRSGSLAITAAAALLLGALALDMRTNEEPRDRGELVRSAAIQPSSPLVDTAVLSAVSPIVTDDSDDAPAVAIERRRVHVRPVATKPAPIDHEGDELFDLERLEPAPLEEDDLAVLSPVVGAPVQVPGLRRSYTLDPFAEDPRALAGAMGFE
jgi:hypothetical protein